MNWQWWSFASILAIPSLTFGIDISFPDPIVMICDSALIAQGSIAASDSGFVLSVDTIFKGPQNDKGPFCWQYKNPLILVLPGK